MHTIMTLHTDHLNHTIIIIQIQHNQDNNIHINQLEQRIDKINNYIYNNNI